MFMLIRHIELEQVAQPESIFGKKTKLGLEIPSGLLRLRQTAIEPTKERDFEPTIPLVGADQTPWPRRM
jgi:hypothetical protein